MDPSSANSGVTERDNCSLRLISLKTSDQNDVIIEHSQNICRKDPTCVLHLGHIESRSGKIQCHF